MKNEYIVANVNILKLKMTRFVAVQGRPGIRATVAEKFVEIFNWYETDLEEVHKIYETHKVSFKFNIL